MANGHKLQRWLLYIEFSQNSNLTYSNLLLSIYIIIEGFLSFSILLALVSVICEGVAYHFFIHWVGSCWDGAIDIDGSLRQ
jgi:hypothetical protein